MNKRHFITGALFWLAVLAGGYGLLRDELSRQSSSVSDLSDDLMSWASGQKQSIPVESRSTLQVALDDPIFLELADGEFRQVGMAVNIDGRYVRDPQLTRQFDIILYDDAKAAFPDGYELEYHTTPTSLDWVVKTMIPKERQKEIAAFIAKEWQLNQQELVAELKPVIKEGVRTAVKAVEDELPDILRAHRPEFRELGDKYETEILKEEILPLVKEEILPIVEEEAVPVAEDVGKTLWKKVSLWSFAWRFIADKSSMSKKDRVKEEFQRFVDEEALPELRSRSEEFKDVTETIVKRSMENPKVKAALKRNLKRVAEDPELHRLIAAVVREAVVENETLRNALEDHMKNQQTKTVMKMAGDRMEPMVRDIGDMIFGSREKGITPEFSRILRSQILKKDRRWFVMVPREASTENDQTVVARIGLTPMIYPMGFGGTDLSPLTPVQK